MSAANKSGRQSASTLRRDRQQRSTGSGESLNQTGYVGTSPTIKAIKSFDAVAEGVEVHHVASGESRAEFNSDRVIERLAVHCCGSERLVDRRALCRRENPGERRDLSKIATMLAGIKHSGNYLVDGPFENPLPFIKQRGSAGVARPHVADIAPSERYDRLPTSSQFS